MTRARDGDAVMMGTCDFVGRGAIAAIRTETEGAIDSRRVAAARSPMPPPPPNICRPVPPVKSINSGVER